MLDNERSVLKENAELLAHLLTENVPYLLSNYLQNGVLTEVEREDIISQGSAQNIKLKLFETLARKDIALQPVLQGLEATENHCVSKEIENLLSGKSEYSQEESSGAGEKISDVSAYATNFVDDVIATAEESPLLRSQEEVYIVKEEPKINGSSYEEEEEMPIVQASVEVHNAANDVSEDEGLFEEPSLSPDAVDKSVMPPEKYTSVIEDTKINDYLDAEEEQVEEEQRQVASPEEDDNRRFDAQPESENDDDQIDIEKEFMMPAEAESNNNEDKKATSKGNVLTRMQSNDIILDDGGERKDATENDVGPGSELGASLARKALVKQHREKFEQTAPGGGKVQYSLRTAAVGKDQGDGKQQEGQDSNVKNLKNFFQRLSTTESKAASTPAASVKPVGKLKVTFPASS